MNISFLFPYRKSPPVRCAVHHDWWTFCFLKDQYIVLQQKKPTAVHFRIGNGILFHYINQAPLFLSSLAGRSRHQSSFLRLSMLLHYTFSVLQQSHYQ